MSHFKLTHIKKLLSDGFERREGKVGVGGWLILCADTDPERIKTPKPNKTKFTFFMIVMIKKRSLRINKMLN